MMIRREAIKILGTTALAPTAAWDWIKNALGKKPARVIPDCVPLEWILHKEQIGPWHVTMRYAFANNGRTVLVDYFYAWAPGPNNDDDNKPVFPHIIFDVDQKTAEVKLVHADQYGPQQT
jgi:hypothetical protein